MVLIILLKFFGRLKLEHLIHLLTTVKGLFMNGKSERTPEPITLREDTDIAEKTLLELVLQYKDTFGRFAGINQPDSLFYRFQGKAR